MADLREADAHGLSRMEKAIDRARRNASAKGLDLLIELLIDDTYTLSMDDRVRLVDFIKNGRCRGPGRLPAKLRTIDQRMKELNERERRNAPIVRGWLLYKYIVYRRRRYHSRVRHDREALVERIASRPGFGDKRSILARLNDPQRYGLETPDFEDRFIRR